MDIVPPVIASAPPPADISPPPSTAAIAHKTHAARQSSQSGNCQPDLDPVNQSIALFHIR
jgi:hypothetical protein